jgi:hypothetical protein
MTTRLLNTQRIVNLSSDPVSGTAGEVYYNTSSNSLKVYTGSSWTEIGAGSSLPSQTGNSGKFLSTSGSAASWESVTKTTVGLSNVENTALSTWAGSTNITTLGTIATGTWQGSSISTAYTAAKVTSVNGSTGAISGLAVDNTVVHLAGTETITGAKTFSSKLIVNSENSEGSIEIGDISTGTSSTDQGVFFVNEAGTIESAIFTEVDGQVLSYGVNVNEITEKDAGRTGGIFRLDTRSSYNEFAVISQDANEIVNPLDRIVVKLDTGDTHLVPNGGNVGIGTESPVTKFHISADGNNVSSELVTSDFFVLSAQDTAPGISIVSANDLSAGGRGVFKAVRSRGTLSAPTAPLENDSVFSLLGAVYDGNGNNATAEILMAVDGQVSDGVSPQRIVFSTGETSGRTERLRITSAGNVGIGTSSPASALHVSTSSSTPLRLQSTTNLASIFMVDPVGGIFLTNDQSAFRVITGTDTAGSGGTERLRITSTGNVGIGTSSPEYKLQVNGSFAATTKSFDIAHPTKENMRLRYASLEGDEHGVYIRGKSNSSTITLPDYWTGLVDEDSITVQLTSIGKHKNLYVKDISNNTVTIGGCRGDFEFFYFIQAERKDIDKLVVEYGN